ncbi:low-density lipoprotein receptor repeat domain-containing protein cueball [Temnothorax americanus]|uniref:low-density lipoprotein receptor repeat domain-containing protein cueball n=1 Tax=Temnothorax americanus TaxID=1964332 RepID=UPI0040685801
MISAETRHLLPSTLLLLCNLVVATYARSWDLAVVIGNEIDFFARNSTPMGHASIGDAVALTGVTYDDTTRTMYLSDVRNNVSIFSNDLTERNFTSTPLLKKESGMHIVGIVFDTSSRTLFWVDALKDIIAQMRVPLNGELGDPVVLLNLTGSSPRGIALDVCNSRIYWVNSNISNPSIECSNLDGSDRTIVIKENLYEPLSVAIDHAERKLYWIDDVEGIHFKIERSNLDGSQRELLVHSKHQQPVYLAVDSESIYWSDWVYSAIWTMPKSAKAGDIPIKFKSYYDSRRDADPAGIVTRDNVGQIDCATILSTIEKRTNLSVPAPRPAATFNNLTTSTEESDLTTESSKYCLNDGHLNKTSNTCRCKEGFSGPFCEISLCHNYCLRGKCIVNHHGFPECICTDTFSGTRCETDVCNDYCLYDGECSVQDGRPSCSCKYSKGTRCEEPNDIAEICTIYCASDRIGSHSISLTSCRCTDSNQTAERITLSDSFQNGTLLPIFVAFTALLLVMLAILSYYVNKLRRRPRIKRHYVVSKGVTPLTSRPQIPDQCEITIENCCNMNICETPCFEPKLRNGVSRSNNMKKEEKNSLLDNMEGNSC